MRLIDSWCEFRSGGRCDGNWRRDGFGRRCDGGVLWGDRRLIGFTVAEQPLQQAWAIRFCRGLQLTQGFTLQAAEFTEEQRDFAGLADPTIQLFGEILQGRRTSRGSGNFAVE